MKRGARILTGIAAMAAALVIAFYAGKLAGNVRLSAPNAAVQVRDDAAFDAWYYRETAGPHNASEAPDGPFAEIGQIGRGFVFAVFDAETGLFIFTSQFG